MRYDLLLRDRKGYTYEGYMAKKVAAAFEKLKIPFKMICLGDGVLQDYMYSIRQDPPKWMISFVNVVPHAFPFCDIVQVPQFIWLKNSPAEARAFLGSNLGLLGLPLPTDLPKTVHLPHGVEAIAFQERIFDTVSFTPLEEGGCMLTETKEGRLDIFGKHQGNNWLKRLPRSVSLHAELPYIEHFSVLAQSKVVVLDSESLHWKMAAVAAGCVPLLADEEDLQEEIAGLLHDPHKRKIYLEQLYPHLPSWEKQTEKLLGYLE